MCNKHRISTKSNDLEIVKPLFFPTLSPLAELNNNLKLSGNLRFPFQIAIDKPFLLHSILLYGDMIN